MDDQLYATIFEAVKAAVWDLAQEDEANAGYYPDAGGYAAKAPPPPEWGYPSSPGLPAGTNRGKGAGYYVFTDPVTGQTYWKYIGISSTPSDRIVPQGYGMQVYRMPDWVPADPRFGQRTPTGGHRLGVGKR